MMPLILGLLLMSVISGTVTKITGYYNVSMLLCPIFAAVGSVLITTYVDRLLTPVRLWHRFRSASQVVCISH